MNVIVVGIGFMGAEVFRDTDAIASAQNGKDLFFFPGDADSEFMVIGHRF